MELDTLLDYLLDGTEVDIFDLTTGEIIEHSLTVDEAREWASENEHEFCSFDPKNETTITVNVELY